MFDNKEFFKMLRRIGLGFVITGLVVCFVLLQINTSTAQEQSDEKSGRVIILGFDGVEPSIVESMIKVGELPSLSKLQKQGKYQRLGSSNPPQSPTAWSSFATCTNPGNHGIFDFLRRRDVKRYIPGVGFGITKHPELAPDGALIKNAAYENYRKGKTFWAEANKQDIPCKVLVVPFAYPAEDLNDSCMLCGLDVPDIRGTQSTYFAISETITKKESVAGGVRLPLNFNNDTATVMVPGARDTRIGYSKPGAFLEVPVTFKANRTSHEITVEIQDQTKTLAEGTWSEWFEWKFVVSPKLTVHAISRIHVLEAGEKVRLYMTCLQFHPRHPYIPISSPLEYSSELADRYGLYKTVGWAYDTKALEKDALTEDIFLDDVEKTMSWREMLVLDELDRNKFGLLVGAWTGTDRVAHLFWRFRDLKHPMYTKEGAEKYGRAIENTYIKMDQIVGKVMSKINDNDLLIVMSDHGFHSFRKGFNLNTWLIRNGYLTVKGKTDPATAYTDKKYLMGYDWSKSKAYGLGLGGLFLNLKGREGQGIVTPEEAPALITEIQKKLLAVTDPETGDKVFDNVYTNEIYKGISQADAPDIQLGYAEGYQTDKPSAAGGAPNYIFRPNMAKWSGEHAASDIANTKGILFANKALKDGATLIDLGVTALDYLGLKAPETFEGKSVLPGK